MKVTEQDLNEANDLITRLNTLYENTKGKGSKRSRPVKRNDYFYQPSGVTISSWKMNEWDYKKNRTPTQIRGLFTRQTKNDRYEIVIRGYDKFFNIDEVSDTRVHF